MTQSETESLLERYKTALGFLLLNPDLFYYLRSEQSGAKYRCTGKSGYFDTPLEAVERVIGVVLPTKRGIPE